METAAYTIAGPLLECSALDKVFVLISPVVNFLISVVLLFGIKEELIFFYLKLGFQFVRQHLEIAAIIRVCLVGVGVVGDDSKLILVDLMILLWKQVSMGVNRLYIAHPFRLFTFTYNVLIATTVLTYRVSLFIMNIPLLSFYFVYSSLIYILSPCYNFPSSIECQIINIKSQTKMNVQSVFQIVTPIAVTQEDMVYSNKVYLSQDSTFPEYKKYLLLKGYVFSYELSAEISKGKIGLSKKFREFLAVSLIDQVQVKLFEPRPKDSPATSVTLTVQFLLPPKERTEVDDSQLSKYFIEKYNGYFVAMDQSIVLFYKNNRYVLTIDKVLGSEDGFSYLSKQTIITCNPSPNQKIKLKSSKNVQKDIFGKNFSLEALGIGGLNQQLSDIFRRAFASRRLPHSMIEKFGLKHVKGILLYGPPGTGKTLIARQLSKSLNAKSFTKVDGPQIFGKFVGESEQNIRKVFQPARDDERKYGEESPLHVIVFDQIDAICRQRGSDSSSASSKDAVVNQLLTNLDGVEALNNIIVIGMTNRKDLLDEAILRPGRLQVHIEIGIPDEEGRNQIFQIHTKRLVEQKLLDQDVSLSKLSAITQNYTGAQIEAVVKNACAYAMTKGNDVMDFSKNFTLKKGTTVNMNDFVKAIKEVPPCFGCDQQNLEVILRNPIYDYGRGFQAIKKKLLKSADLTLNGYNNLSAVFLYGKQGSGTTTIASTFAKQSKFNFVKIISPEKFVGIGPIGKINSIDKVFRDAYRSTSSLIVIDNIDRIVEYVQTGPDFNNPVLHSLASLLAKPPTNPQCKLLIIGTSSSLSSIQLLDLDSHFGIKVEVPYLSREQCSTVLGVDLGIANVPIKKLSHFKSICEDKPKSMWKKIWETYSG